MSTDDHMETITDPAAIRDSDEPSERGDFPCCATPAPVGAAMALDLDAIEARANAATDGPWRHGNWSDHLGDRRVISGGDGCYEVERLDIMRAHDAEFIAHARGDVPDLVAKVRRLTEEAATQREWFEAADAAAERRLDQSIAWMERAEAAEAEVVTLRARLAAVEARVVEWESDRDVCLAWIADPAMHADEGHPDRLSRVADSLDRHARAMRAALATAGEGQ